jgi:DNA-binding transcriptional MerR regulator
MITSDRQLKVTQSKIEDIKTSLTNELTEVPRDFRQGILNQRQELIHELEEEVTEYLKLKSRKLDEIPISSIEDIKLAPIRFRLAAGMTIEQFAQLVGVHSRQIARYEEEEYEKITVENLTKILAKIQPKISGTMVIGHK